VAIVGEGTAYGAAIAPAHLGFRISTGFELPFNRAHATDALFECFFRMPIGLIEGFRSLASVMKVTQVVGHAGPGGLHGFSDGALAITDDGDNRHTQGLVHAAQESGQVGVARG
jgi:hypothetical protein